MAQEDLSMLITDLNINNNNKRWLVPHLKSHAYMLYISTVFPHEQNTNKQTNVILCFYIHTSQPMFHWDNDLEAEQDRLTDVW